MKMKSDTLVPQSRLDEVENAESQKAGPFLANRLLF